MPDEKHPVRALDVVAVAENVRFWMHNLGVSETAIRAAVARVGCRACDMRTGLRRQRARRHPSGKS